MRLKVASFRVPCTLTTPGISRKRHDCRFSLFNNIDLPGFQDAGLIIGTGDIQLHIGEVIALAPKLDVISSLVIPRYGSRVDSIFFNANAKKLILYIEKL